MLNFSLTLLGKLLSKSVQFFNLGNGSTWPGHIALKANPHFISELLSNSKLTTILIAGTNGKTTTSLLIRTTLEASGKKVLQNESGANLLNGIASTLLLNTSANGKLKQDLAIFEIDENTLPLILKELTPDYIILLNLFRDQLDRYGEINTIAGKWKKALADLPDTTTLILNADDPQIAYLGHKTKAKTLYFGLQPSQFSTHKLQHAADSVYCPKCGEKLHYLALAFSHLGDWHCQHCGLKRPYIETRKFAIYPLTGLYNKYNTLASLQVLEQIGVPEEQIEDTFTDFAPAFGRQEIIEYHGKKVQLFLSKNPTSFNQSYETIKSLGAKKLLIVLNDRIPDGRDVSWIWDVDLPEIEKFEQILISGDRVYDMALRIKYEDYKKFQMFENLKDAIDAGIEQTKENETFFILPTYSAMLESRKILTGKKIL